MSTWGIGQNDPSQELLALREKVASKETQIAAYQTQVARKDEKYDELKQLYDEVVNKLRDETEKALTLEKDLRQCTEDFRREKINVENIEASLIAAQQAAKSANTNTLELESTLDSLTLQSNTFQEQCQYLQRDKAKLEENVRELQRLISQPPPSSAKAKQSTHRPRSSSLTSFRISTLETDVNDTRTRLQQKEGELDILIKKLASVQVEANRVSNEKSTLEKKTRAQIAELEEALAEREEELAYLRGTESGGSREQELIERIEEDGAKLEALEAMLRHAQDDVDCMETKVKQTEVKLQEEARKAQRLAQQHLQVKEEKENLLMELSAAHSEIQTLHLEKKGRPSLNSIDADMDDLTKPQSANDDTTQPLPDEDTVEYIERLLSAIDRLRDERDSLRRDVQFLESESRFAIEALETKLSRSMAASTASTDETLRTVNQMKMEMDALHAQLEEVQAAADSRVWDKAREIRRLSHALAALSVVVAHPTSVTDVALGSTLDDARVIELEERIEATSMRLEVATSARDELAETLREKEEDLRNASMEHQEANRHNQDLSNQVTDLANTVGHLESERDSLAIHIKNLENDLQRAQEELTTAETRYSDLQFHQLSSMPSSEATQNLRNQIQELEGRIMRRNEQLGIHQHDIRRLETNLRLQEERLNEMTTELEMMTAEKAAMVEDCADARDVRDEALRKMEDMEEGMEDMEHAAEQADVTIMSLVGVVFETVARSRRAIGTSQHSSSGPDELQATLELIEDLKEDNAHLEKSLEMYNERINQLTAHTVNLEGQHAATVANSEATKNDFHGQITALQGELEEINNMKASMEQAHSVATRELEGEIDRLHQRLRDAEENAFREASQGEDLALLHSRIAELQAMLARADDEHAAQLEELHTELESLTTSKKGSEDQLVALQNQLTVQDAEHERASSVLQAELVKERQNLKQVQQSFEAVEQTRKTLLEELDQLQETLATVKQEFETEKGRSLATSQGRDHEVDLLTTQVNGLTSRLEAARIDREAVDQGYQAALSTLKDQHNAEIIQLKQEVEGVRQAISQVEAACVAAETERTDAQQQATDLIAKIEQNKSLLRSMESQVDEKERSITTLKAEVVDLQCKLNTAEQAGAKATLNVSLLTAQHKRELSDAQRELDRLRSNGNLEQVIAELEERNQDMEQLLKQKCAEIEENDDRALEMLKENKKLTTKVETLTRKVQTLQGKVTNLKASSPKAPSSAKASSATSTAARPRSATVVSSQQPATSTSQSQRVSMPSSSSRPPSRAASGSSASLRPKTPERTRAPVFTSKSQENLGSKAQASARPSTSPVGEAEAVAGRKRRAPDDFEACDNVPPQAFTADSMPKVHSDDKTPRVRRALSTLQSGFTPVRTFANNARPVAPLPSPKRNQNPSASAQVSYYISDMQNAPLNVLPSPAFAPPPSGKASNKRSWLGKIRGQDTSQGPSRPQ